ncbi:MAG: oxygen-dependent coproporphyrinogen oxidase [Flavobacteriales bacterium]
MDKWKIAEEFKRIQDEICLGLEAEDGAAKFMEDAWTHSSGGGGRTRVISGGGVFEKGGVNFSAVEGSLPVFMKDKVNEGASQFFATGVSIVIHPASPMVPIIHMNIRYFETDAGDAWFGGGIDLTPIYVNDEQARYFHACLKEVCDQYNADYYPRFKQWADDYFFITHRNETRGIGGVFFDYLRPDEHVTKERLFEFVVSVGDTFLKAYRPIVNANKPLAFNEHNKQWQLIRRGRYVEFNLVYDRGTRFGLETGGRIESILMSLPEHASWIYNHALAEDSEEYATWKKLRKGIDWAIHK